jgi:hypothetical protein
MNKFAKLLAISLFGISSSVFAQSSFQGFYGQIGVGYENNSPSTSSYTYYFPNLPSPRGRSRGQLGWVTAFQSAIIFY